MLRYQDLLIIPLRGYIPKPVSLSYLPVPKLVDPLAFIDLALATDFRPSMKKRRTEPASAYETSQDLKTQTLLSESATPRLDF